MNFNQSLEIMRKKCKDRETPISEETLPSLPENITMLSSDYLDAVTDIFKNNLVECENLDEKLESSSSAFVSQPSYQLYKLGGIGDLSEPQREWLEYVKKQQKQENEKQTVQDTSLNSLSSISVGAKQLPKDREVIPNSSLSVSEHQEFLHLEKIMNDSTTRSTADASMHARYHQLRSQVQEEQKQYLQEKEREAKTSLRDHYTHLRVNIAESIENQIRRRNQECSHYYPLYYRSAGSVSFGGTEAEHQKDDPVLNLVSIVHNSCSLKPIQLPQTPLFLNTSIPLPTLSPPISQDQLAHSLAIQHNADIVITGSAFSALVNTHPPDWLSEYDIPVTNTVPPSSSSSSSSSTDHSSIVFIDKPLVKRSMTGRNKASIFYKHAAIQAILGNTPEVCVRYSLWRFGDLRILLRTKLFACVQDSAKPFTTAPHNSSQKPLPFMVKLEYQYSRGFEEFSTSERARLWTKSFLHGGSSVLVFRIVPESGALVRIDCLDFHQIFNGFRDNRFIPENALKRVFLLLNSLKNRSPQKYLASHRSTDPRAVIMRALGNHETSEPDLDLSKHYPTAGRTDSMVDYIPVSWQSAANQIPFTFPPPGSESKSSGKKRKKKKKKKKKKS